MLPLLKAKEARIMRVIKCVICVQTGHLCYEYKIIIIIKKVE